MEGNLKGKTICIKGKSPTNKSIPPMAPPKISLGGNHSSTSISASRTTIDPPNSTEISQDQASRPDSGPNYVPNMDPRKLRRIMSNRLSAQRSRMKKVQYVASLEMQAKGFETHIAEVQPQVLSCRNLKQYLILENEALNLQVSTLEKVSWDINAEIESNQVELNMLRELYRMQEDQLTSQMYNQDTSFQPMPTNPQPIMSYDPMIQNYYPNSNQVAFQVAPNGEEAPSMNMDMPQNQSQIWMPGVPDENQNMTQLEVNEMDTNLMNNNAWFNPNHGNGFN